MWTPMMPVVEAGLSSRNSRTSFDGVIDQIIDGKLEMCDLQKSLLERAMDRIGGNKLAPARLLGMSNSLNNYRLSQNVMK